MTDREKVERELRQKYGFSIEDLRDEHVCSDVARLPDGDWRHILPSDARVLWQALVEQGMEQRPAGDDLLRAAELERAAKALWKIGNARIGYREWATVRDHYLNEAQACVATYMGIRCHAGMDGDCNWPGCPQKRDGEPHKSNRHCPYDWQDEED